MKDKTMNDPVKKAARARRLKHGGTALLLTVAVLAAIILLNYAFGALTEAKRLYIDMTGSKIYTVSDAADEIITAVGEEGRDFEIIFFTRFDEMGENSYLYQVYEYSRALAEKYDFISLRYIDSLSHPEEAAAYQTNTIPDLKLTDVVITNGEAKQAFTVESFFTFDTNDTSAPFAFNAEYRICTALMQMTYEDIKACFTVGHGEKTENSSLARLLGDAGFTVEEVNLAADDIPDDARLLIINGPIYDFGGENDAANEIEKIDKFYDYPRLGNVMVFIDPTSVATLTNLGEFLEEKGVRFMPAEVSDPVNAVSADGKAVTAVYVDSGVGSGLTKELRGLDNPPVTVLENAMPIEILWTVRNYGMEIDEVSSTLTSHDTASAYSIADGGVAASGELPLMTVSTHTHVGDNNEKYYNYMLCAGTSKFADDRYLNGNVFGNGDIIYEAVRAFFKKPVPVDLDFKVYDDETLTVTNGKVNAWTAAMVLAGPVIFGILGAVVCLRRRRS